jgi:hypothetical protein
VTTLKEFEEALRERGLNEALEVLERLRARDRESRSMRPARRVVGQRMTPELARRVLELHRSTSMTQQEIAFALGVNQGRVNEVVKRGKWLDGDPASPEALARDRAIERAKAGVGMPARNAPTLDTPKRRAPARAAKAAAESRPERPAVSAAAASAAPAPAKSRKTRAAEDGRHRPEQLRLLGDL